MERPDDANKGSYIGGMIASLVMVWVVNSIPGWNLFFITAEFAAIVKILTTIFFLQAGGYVFLLFYGKLFMHFIIRIAQDSIGIWGLSILIRQFPFDFSTIGPEWLNLGFKILLGVGIFGTVVSIISNTVKLIRHPLENDIKEVDDEY